MRNTFSAIFLLLLSSVSLAADADEATTNGFSKADFRSEIAAPKLRKLLGVNSGNLIIARQDGVTEVVDREGKTLLTLAAKSGDQELLKKPEAAAVANETLYVVDSKTEQVVMYDLSSGKYLGRFGANLGGGLSLDEPQGISVFEGVVYVADTGNERIQMFGINGVFLSTLALSATPGSSAEKDKLFKLGEPTDIALDMEGRIYVRDADDKLIKVYGPNGVFLRALPKTGKPVAMSVAEDGVYVADEASFGILKYDFDANPAYVFGSGGEGKAQFKSLSGLAVDKAQQVYVGDARKALIDSFVVEAGKPLEPLPKAAGRTSVKWLANIGAEVGPLAGDGKETFYAVSNDKKSLVVIRKGVLAGEIKPDDMQLTAVTVDKSGAVWVLDKKKYRAAKLDENGKILLSIGTEGGRAGQFNNPTAIAVSASGMVFVADRSNHNVQVFRGDGVFLNALNGENAGKLSAPVAMVFDQRDNLYILDASRESVLAYSSLGKSLGELGRTKDGSLLSEPVSLMAANDEVLVLDGNQVKVFSPKGPLLRTFGAKGAVAGAFDEPLAIAYGGGSDFAISDKGNKRVQMLSTLHKPEAPQQLAATGKVHAIELNWAAASAPFIKQYRIYRAKSENGNFVQVGTVPVNQFVDPDLDAGVHYYYRVGAETHFGFEGATSAVVSGVPEKFMPPQIGAVQVETTPWQVKMTWAPADPKYFSAYRIYQKDGETYNKIGEVAQPEFIKDGLQPETRHAFYVSTLSSDGTESAKFAVEATTQIFNRPPLEIDVVQLHDVFSNSYKIYEREGVGKIKLTNNTNKSMERIKVTFQLRDFMDFPTETKLDKLLPGMSEEVALKAVFNNSILTLTEDSSVQAMIEASYFENGKRITFNKNPTVNVYDKHRLTWDERGRFATFVTPKDAPVINLVRSVVTQFKDTKDEAQLAAAVFDMLGVYGMTYIQDPSNPYQVSSGKVNTVDYIQFPRETLERKSGDCDDLVAFYSSALESMGLETRVVEVPGHMFMMFSTGIDADDDAYTMDNMYVIYEDKLWIPVETTLVGNAFVKAWEKGAAAYYKWKDKGLTILDVHSAWETYKPASLPVSNSKQSDISRAEIEKKFPSDHMSVLKISSQTKTRRYLNAIKKDPADVDAHLQMGIILAKAGDRDEAMKYFDIVLELQPKNAAALNNRGNIFMIEDKYLDAQKAYVAATQIAPQDALLWVNLARAYKATKDIKKAKAAFVKAQSVDPSVKEEHRALALELLNAL